MNDYRFEETFGKMQCQNKVNESLLLVIFLKVIKRVKYIERKLQLTQLFANLHNILNF